MYLVKKDCPAIERGQKVSQSPTRQLPRGWIRRAMEGVRDLVVGGHKLPKQMRVVETLSMPGRQRLTLVSCSGERFLVGTASDGGQTIVRVRPDKVGAEMPVYAMPRSL